MSRSAHVAHINGERLTIETRKGNMVPNPYLSILNRQTELIGKLCAELGVSPTARQRIVARPASAVGNDPSEQFFR